MFIECICDLSPSVSYTILENHHIMLKELKQKTTPNMLCPKVLILTLLIFGTFAKDTMESMKERIEAMEKKLERNMEKRIEALEVKCKSTLKDLESAVETNAEQIEDLKNSLSTTATLALENQETCEKVNEQSILIQANTKNLEILNTKVIFNAKKTEGLEGFTKVTGDLTFDQVDINIGDGFDGSSGIFRAPLSGIYRMSFSGQSAAYIIDYTQIMVYKNGYPIFFITDGNEAEKADGNNVSYTWIMTLVEGDELKLKSVNYLYANIYIPLTFAGELIHIEN